MKTTIEEGNHPYDNRLSFVKEERIGRIEVTKEFVECARGDAWDLLMKNVRILRAEFDVFKNCITYDCYSPWFESLEGKAVVPPTYVVHFKRDEDTGDVLISHVALVNKIVEYVEDDNVFERIKRTIGIRS
jgi:hypothetical protein